MKKEILNAFETFRLEIIKKIFEEVQKIMQKYGHYGLAQTEYQRFKADSSRFNKADSTVEYLHILEKM